MTESAIRAGSHGIRNTLTGIEKIVKIDVNVTDLEPDDGSKWSAIGWKSPVASPGGSARHRKPAYFPARAPCAASALSGTEYADGRRECVHNY